MFFDFTKQSIFFIEQDMFFDFPKKIHKISVIYGLGHHSIKQKNRWTVR